MNQTNESLPGKEPHNKALKLTRGPRGLAPRRARLFSSRASLCSRRHRGAARSLTRCSTYTIGCDHVMKIALRVLVLSVAMSMLVGLLVGASLGGLEVGVAISVVLGIPLGLAGGTMGVLYLHREPPLPRAAWTGRGSIVGALLGGVGLPAVLLLTGNPGAAALYALLGVVAGAVAGGAAGATLSRVLTHHDSRVGQAGG